MNNGRMDMSNNPTAIRALADQLTVALNGYKAQVESINDEITINLATTWYGETYDEYRNMFVNEKNNVLDPSVEQLSLDIQKMYEAASLLESGNNKATQAMGN